ncbi:hypothetical protein [Devosia nitrariae]|nr:hypothetical protein [Devosia nitrariae]
MNRLGAAAVLLLAVVDGEGVSLGMQIATGEFPQSAASGNPTELAPFS